MCEIIKQSRPETILELFHQKRTDVSLVIDKQEIRKIKTSNYLTSERRHRRSQFRSGFEPQPVESFKERLEGGLIQRRQKDSANRSSQVKIKTGKPH
jgi:hypothetical protein